MRRSEDRAGGGGEAKKWSANLLPVVGRGEV